MGTIVGYAAIIDKLGLNVPIHKPVAFIYDQNKSFEDDNWRVLQPIYLPEDKKELSRIKVLCKHLVFSLEYEGVNFLVFRGLTRVSSDIQKLKCEVPSQSDQYLIV